MQDKNNKSESLCIKKVLSQCYSNLLNVQKLKEWTCCNIAHQQLMEESTIDMKNISVNLVFNFYFSYCFRYLYDYKITGKFNERTNRNV